MAMEIVKFKLKMELWMPLRINVLFAIQKHCHKKIILFRKTTDGFASYSEYLRMELDSLLWIKFFVYEFL